MERVRSLGAVAVGASRINWDPGTSLRTTVSLEQCQYKVQSTTIFDTHVEVVPHLGHDSVTIVGRTSTSCSGVVSWSGASNVWDGTVTLGECGLHGAQRVCGGVAWFDTSRVQEAKGRKTAIIHDGSLEELYNLLVLNILWTVARNVESRVAGCVLGEFVSPEVVVWTTLVDPIRVHIVEQIKLAKWVQEGSNIWTLVWWNDGPWTIVRICTVWGSRLFSIILTICKTVGGVG